METKKTDKNQEPKEVKRTKKAKFPIFKLILGIIICVATIAAGIGLAFLIHAVVTPATVDEIYAEVQEYDYSNGHSEKLESEIKRLIDKAMADNNSTDYISAMKAKTEYYFGLGKYSTVLSVLRDLEGLITNSEENIYIAEYYLKVYTALNNEAMTDKYQAEYDALTKKCGE